MDGAPPAFRDGVAALSEERFAAFVTALWEERERVVTRDGGLLRVEEPTGETRVVYPLAAGAECSVPVEADVVVAAADSPDSVSADVDVLGPADLYRLVRYAVPGPAGDRLLATHVDPALARSAPGGPGEPTRGHNGRGRSGPPATDGDGDSQSGEDWPPPSTGWALEESRRRTVLVAGGAFLGGIGTAVAVLRGGDDEPAADGQPSPATFLAPGLTEDGVADARALSVAHVDRLQEASYTVRATKTIHDGSGRLRSSWSVRVAVDEVRAFRARVATEGPLAPSLAGEPPAEAVFWSDRDTYLRRRTNATGTDYAEVRPRRQINDWYYWSNIVPVGGLPYSTREFYRDLFGTVETGAEEVAGGDAARVVGPTTRLDPPPPFLDRVDRDSPVGNLRLLGRVRPTGLVASLLLGYRGRLGGRPATVQWSIAYDAVGETTVDRPDWYGRATGGG